MTPTRTEPIKRNFAEYGIEYWKFYSPTREVITLFKAELKEITAAIMAPTPPARLKKNHRTIT